jgi:hypothetical protein
LNPDLSNQAQLRPQILEEPYFRLIWQTLETIVLKAPEDKVLIFDPRVRIQENYDILDMKLSSPPNEIVLRIRLPDFDMPELPAIQAKAKETGFIRADELTRRLRATTQSIRD